MDKRTPLSLSFSACSPVPEVLQSPFSTAPDGNLLLAQKKAYEASIFQDDFCGRAGVLITGKNTGELTAYYEAAAFDGKALSLNDVDPEKLWPYVEDADLSDTVIPVAVGDPVTLKSILADIFAPFPERTDHHGRKEQMKTRARWRGFLRSALNSPSVRLLVHYLTGNREERLLYMGEWWCGGSPCWEMRFDRAFYPPEGGARFLFEKMLDGIPHEEKRLIAEKVPEELEVLFEDGDFVVINKPAKLASVSGGRETVSAQSLLEKTRGKLHVMHRLDMGTSGVLAFAKNSEVLREMNKAFRECRVGKKYLARLAGTVSSGEGEINLPIALDWYERPKQCVLSEEKGGRHAATRYRTIGTVETAGGKKTMIELFPVTGRTHQLRVHCAHAMGLGMPIDGDPFYGTDGMKNESPQRRLCLHAGELHFVHPRTGKTINILATEDFPNF